jgi:hypothetical protein
MRWHQKQLAADSAPGRSRSSHLRFSSRSRSAQFHTN